MYVMIAVTVLCTSVMLTYAGRKTIIISEGDEASEASDALTLQTSKWTLDISRLTDEASENITLALPEGEASAPEVSIRYDEPQLTVLLKNTRESYFLSNPPSGNFQYVEKVTGIYDGDNTSVVFTLTEPCFLDTEYVYGKLYLKLLPVKENEKTVVAVDAGHGGLSYGTRAGDLSEKDILLKVALKVAALTEDRPYRVALLRDSDITMNTEARIKALNTVKASYYAGLQLSSDVDDVMQFGLKAVYNPSYYHDGLENADFAECLLRATAARASDRANSIDEAGEEELILKTLNIPAAVLYLGYMSNTDEAALLASDEYLDKLAEGIVDALDEVVR